MWLGLVGASTVEVSQINIWRTYPPLVHFTESNTDASATVLLVEDDRPLLEFFSTVLRRDGHTVLEAENGAEIRVILTSGLPMEIVMERCGPGFKGEFLPKPFSVFDLSGRIKRLSEAA